MGRRSGVWAALRHLPGDGSLVSDRVVAGGEEVAVVEAGVLVPQVTELVDLMRVGHVTM